jgi:oligopeptidase B
MPSPPRAARRPHPVTAHGHTRVDEYYWLRERENPEVLAYLESENRYAAERTAHTATLQEQIFEELRAAVVETDETAPVRLGQYEYFTRTEAGAQYPIHCRRRETGAETEVLLDENALAAGSAFFNLGGLRVSPDERLLAYTVASTGGEVFDLFVKDIASGALVDGPLHSVSAEVEWAADSTALFYTTHTEAWRSYRAFRHTLGHPQQEDVLVYEEGDAGLFLHIRRGRSGAYLLLESNSGQTWVTRVVPLDRPDAPPRLVTPVRAGVIYRVQHSNGRFYIHTNDGGSGFRLVSAPEDDPAEERWEVVAPEQPGVSQEGFDLFAGHLALYESVDGLVRLRTIDIASGDERIASFPEPAYSLRWWPTEEWPLNPAFETRTLWLIYSSPVTPPQTLDYAMDDGSIALVKQNVPPGYDPERFTVERLWAIAPDDVRVPISLVRPKGMPPGEPRPCLLTGYGAYGSAFEPAFNARWLPLLERGFVCAIAHVRGGGDLGELWYRGGRALAKHNTFTDFIACAEHLVAQGYTRPELLACSGRSAGGLLIGAVVTMRPDLFRAALAIVPFLDVVTTSLDPTIPLVEAEYEEWGDPRDPAQYAFMLTYSPYDNIAARPYPAILATAGLHDPRVQYWEPAKFVAKLRANKTDDRALLLKTEMSGGHRGPSGRYDHLRETAFEWAFVLDALGG